MPGWSTIGVRLVTNDKATSWILDCQSANPLSNSASSELPEAWFGIYIFRADCRNMAFWYSYRQGRTTWFSCPEILKNVIVLIQKKT